MAKYVCDYDTVESIANAIKNISDNMTDTANNYEKTIKNDLSGWSGEAQTNFNNSVQQQSTQINNKINSVLEMSQFITKAADEIRKTDEELASLNI